MDCRYCSHNCHKKGKQKNGKQKYRCVSCKKYQQGEYGSIVYQPFFNSILIRHITDGCGIRSTARILAISTTTVINRTKKIADSITKPETAFGKEYELDEMKTFIGSKKNKCWIAYAIRKDDRSVTDFRVGKRTKKTLRGVVETLLLSKAKKIYTDGLDLYRYLIPRKQHSKKKFMINHIERKNLTLRTHLRRLSRRTICFSRNAAMLAACLKIYFWGS